ncbi:DUF2461 domain-containing protein [Ammonicoccus fulvus]|uniref:DUF2461 domain-containing protein n=1 Tax=Ammonicoccus fulvus TaxID=3138240 RepID=A0ABZ3FJM9_9ACTN
MSDFEGFPPGLFTFFEGLAQDNSKTYWEAHKTEYAENVRKPMLALLNELGAEFGPLRMFRPNRDVRFSKDKSPYKDWAGATSEDRARGGMGYYLRVSETELVTGFGAAMFDRDQLARFRELIDNDETGVEFENLRTAQDKRKLPITGGIESPLKRTPAGFAKDHPRSEILRWKGAFVVEHWERADWMSTREAFDRIHDVWTGAQPLGAWLERHLQTDAR